MTPASGSLTPGFLRVSAPPKLQTLTDRADFLRAARGKKISTDSFLLQACRRQETQDAIRVGYTCSKKIGNAVTRNRGKRRLRHLAAEVLPHLARPGWDYVLVGRPGKTVTANFADMRSSLITALQKLHPAP